MSPIFRFRLRIYRSGDSNLQKAFCSEIHHNMDSGYAE